MDSFDADVLIYAAVPLHPLGSKVAALFTGSGVTGIGSVLLLPEVLAKPMRNGNTAELTALAALLGKLDLRPLDRATASLSAGLAARHRLKAADAVHLATAINAGASRFLTNNRRDFPSSIGELRIVYPEALEATGTVTPPQ